MTHGRRSDVGCPHGQDQRRGRHGRLRRRRHRRRPGAFHADWEARVVGLFNALRAEGLFNTNEFRDAIESMPPAEYLTTSYYERWFEAIRALLERKGVIEPGELDD